MRSAVALAAALASLARVPAARGSTGAPDDAAPAPAPSTRTARPGDALTPEAAAERGLRPSLVALRPVTSLFQHLYDGRFGPVNGVSHDPVHGEIYVADGAGLVGIFDSSFVPLFAFSGGVAEPVKAIADGRGRIYVLEGDHRRIRVFNYRGEHQRDLEVPGLDPAVPPAFTALAVDPDGTVYVGDAASSRVVVLDPEGRPRLTLGERGSGPGQFLSIAGIAVDRGSIYVTDHQGIPVQVFDKRGNWVRGWGAHEMGAQNFSLPEGIAIDRKGRVIVVDGLRHDVKVFEPDGRFIDRWGGFGVRPGEVASPADVAVDEQGHVLVAEKGGRRVQVFLEVEGYRDAQGVPVAVQALAP